MRGNVGKAGSLAMLVVMIRIHEASVFDHSPAVNDITQANVIDIVPSRLHNSRNPRCHLIVSRNLRKGESDTHAVAHRSFQLAYLTKTISRIAIQNPATV
jgi:hypothetical protein